MTISARDPRMLIPTLPLNSEGRQDPAATEDRRYDHASVTLECPWLPANFGRPLLEPQGRL
jgi:hypothetical protein